MSSVDNRVVKMTFDNEQFERGVSKSMSTLDKLEEKLQFKKAATGLQSLQVAINGVAFDRFATAIEGIEKKLSGVGVAAATVVSRITNSLIDGAIKIERATIGQIQSGGWSRAMKLENAKFTVEGLKLDWETMLKAINYGVQDTAYGLDAAASAAAQLAASGVQYKESIDGANDSLMHRSLRAISGVAAMTNSSYEEISRIFASAAGSGSVMGDHLQQLAARGLNAAAVLAKAMNTTEAQIREMAHDRAIDFETFAILMDDAFGAHAKEANKTFNGALSNMKAALSRFGAVFATPVIQKTNTFFIALTDRIKEMKNAISDVKLESGELEKHLEGHFADMWEELITLADVLVHKIDLTWFWEIADAADAVVVKITNMLATLNDLFYKEAEGTSETAKKVYDLSTITKEELELAQDVIKGNYGNGQARVKALSEAAEKLGLDPTKIQEYVNAVAKYGYSFDKAGIKVKEAGEEVEEVAETVTYMDLVVKDAYTNLSKAFNHIKNTIPYIREAASKFLNAFFGGFSSFSSDAPTFTKSLRNIAYEFYNVAKKLKPSEYALTVISRIAYTIAYAFDFARGIVSYFVKSVYGFIKNVVSELRENTTFLDIILKVLPKIRDVLDVVYYSIAKTIDSAIQLGYTLYGAVSDFITSNVGQMGVSVFELLASAIMELANILSPTDEGLLQFYSIVQAGCSILFDLYDIFRDVIREILSFTIAQLKSYKEAGKFNNIASSITNTFVQLYRIIKSIGKIASGIFRALAIGFFNVFRPDMAVGYVSMFTMGIADLLEMLEPSESTIQGFAEAFTVVFKVIDTVIELILKLITTISSMFTSMNNKKKGIDGVEDTFDGMSDITVIVIGLIDILKEKIMGFFDYLETIPDKISGFADLLEQEEGVIRLKNAVDNLWKGMKDAVTNGVSPFQDMLDDLSKTLNKEITMEDVADGIGWMADKLGWFIEQLPGWSDKVYEVFNEVKTQVETTADDVWKKLKELWGKIDNTLGISDLISKIFGDKKNDTGEVEETLGEKTGGIINDIIKKIKDHIDAIDWTKIGGDFLTVGTTIFLWRLAEFTEALGAIMANVASIPKNLSKILGSVSELVDSIATSISRFSLVTAIVAIAAAILAIAAAIWLISNIPEDALSRAAGIIIFIGVLVWAIAKVLGFAIKAITKKQILEVTERIHNFANTMAYAKATMAKTLVNAVAFFIIGMTIVGMVRIMVQTFIDLATFFNSVDATGGSIAGAVIVIIGIFVVLAILVGVALAFMSKIKKAMNLSKNFDKIFKEFMTSAASLAAIGFAVLAMSASVWLIAQALVNLSNTDLSWQAILAVAAIVAALGVGIALITKNVHFLSATDALGLAAVLFVFALGVAAIVGIVVGLAILMQGENLLGLKDTIFGTMIGISILILSMGAAMYLIGETFSKESAKPGWIILGILAMVGVILAIGYAIALIGGGLSEIGDTNQITIAVGGMIVIVAVMALLIIGVVDAISKLKTKADAELNAVAVMIFSMAIFILAIGVAFALVGAAFANYDATQMQMVMNNLLLVMFGFVVILSTIVGLAAKGAFATAADDMIKLGKSMLLIAASIAVFGVAMAIIAYALSNTTSMLKLLGSLGAFIVVIAAVFGIFWGLSKLSKTSLTDLAPALQGLGLALVLISASIVVFAVAVLMLAQIPEDSIMNVVYALAAFVGVVLVLSIIGSIFGLGMKAISISLLVLSASVIVFGIGLATVAAGLAAILPLAPSLEAHLAIILGILSANQTVVMIIAGLILVVVIALTILAMKTLPAFVKIVNAVVTIIETVAKSVQAIVERILTFLENRGKNAAEKGKSWIQNIGPKAKVLIGTMILSAASAITESGPQVLQKIGKLVLMAMDWLIDMTGPLIAKLISWIIEIINGLADAISGNSNKLAAAVGNLALSLIEVLISGIAMIVKGSKLGNTALGNEFVGNLEQWQKDIRDRANAMKETAAAADDYKQGLIEYNELAETINKGNKGNTNIVSSVVNKDKIEDDMSYLQEATDKQHTMLDLMKKYGANMKFELQNDIPQAAKDVMVKQGAGDWGEDGNFYSIMPKPPTVEQLKDYINIDELPGAIKYGLNSEGGIPDAIDSAFVSGGEGAGDSMLTGMTNGNFQDTVSDIMSQTGYDGGMAFDDAQAIGIYDGQSEVLAATDNNSSAQIQAIKDTYGELHKVGKGQTEAQAGGINDGYFDLHHASNNALDAVRSPWYVFNNGSKDAPGSGRNLGYGGANSLLDGFQGAVKEWPAAIQHAFGNAYEAGEEAFIGPKAWDVNSPSKRTMYWGQMIINGLTTGINDATPDAITSMTELSNSMINSFTNPLDYVSRVASGELTYDPSIRPVLDTSSIATGAYGIRSMFDNQNVSLSGFSGKLAADITGLDTTNTQVVSELKALRTEMNVMTDKITGMQIIMDSGQLVGAIAPGMDDALGRRAVHRGRGN